MNRKMIAGGVAVIALIAFGWIAFGRGGEWAGAGGTSGRAFFSDDDGKTWFADDAAKIPPFMHSGKQAAKAYVYKCKDRMFVNHLERYTPEAKKQIEDVLANPRAQKGPGPLTSALSNGSEVKAPGDAAWRRASDPLAAEVQRPKCPDGGSGAEPVTP